MDRTDPPRTVYEQPSQFMDNPGDLFRLQRFRRTTLGLWVPHEEQPQQRRTELPLFIAERLLPEGPALFLPSAPKPPEDTLAFVSEAELGLPPLGREGVVAALAELPSEATFVILSLLQRRLWRASSTAADHLALARDIYGDAPVVAEMGKWCAQEGHVLFSEQGVFALFSHAVVHCRSDSRAELTDDEVLALKRLLLAAPALLHEDDELGDYNDEEPEEWLAYLLQNLLFNAKANFGSGIARTWRLFGELASDPLREWKTTVDIDELTGRTGLDLSEQLAFAFGLYSVLGVDGDLVAVAPEGWRDIAQRIAGDGDPSTLVPYISATPEEMREELTGPIARRLDPQLRWASVPFLERPFLRLADDRLLLVSPRALEAWPTDGVYYRLLRAASERDRATGAQTFTAFAGELTEAYTVELLEAEHERAARDHLAVGRIERAQPLSSEPGVESTDVFAHERGDVVLLEISSSRITAPTRLAGDLAALQRDMLKLVTKRVQQLDRSVEALSSGDIVLSGLAKEKIRRFFPVIVNVEPMRWTPPLHAYLRREVPDLLQQPGVQPLQFVELEDLEALLSALGPPALADLIAAKLQALGTDPDIQQWLHSHPTAPRVDRPITVTETLDRAMVAVMSALGFDSEEVRKRQAERADEGPPATG